MRAIKWNLSNFVSLFTSYSFKRKKGNALKKQSFLENINVPCRACLSYVYALKLPSEVKTFSY